MMSERSTRSRNSVAARVLAQVQRDGFLVARVHRPEEVMAVEFGLAPGAQRVGRARRLDLDDLGAHVAEQPARERTRDQRADLDHPDAVQRAGRRVIMREPVPVQPVRADADGLAQRAALVRSGVVVVGAGDLVHLLVRMPDRLEQPAGVAGRAGVVGQVADDQGGHRDVGAGTAPRRRWRRRSSTATASCAGCRTGRARPGCCSPPEDRPDSRCPGVRSFGSTVGSSQRGSAMVPCTTNPNSSSGRPSRP